MRFRNYCIVVMGATENDSIKKEIEKVSDSKINILDARGIVIGTFTSALSTKELSDFFKLNDRNFLLFDLNEENSGVNIIKKEIHEGLFGFLKDMNEDNLEDKAVEFLKDIETHETKRVVRPRRDYSKPKKLTQDDIDKMSNKEKDELQNSIIDNGLENMSEYDKEILSFLWK
jgi:hypothetical protein